jgi:hypothetical protein
MRALLISALLAVTIVAAEAQQQEQKLLDRLLKPNMALENKSYDKQFIAGGATLDKKARTKTFYVADRRAEKRFVTGDFATTSFATRASRYHEAKAKIEPRNNVANADAVYPTPGYRGVHAARDSAKAVEVSEFAGTRPFLVRGKSQKSLSAQDRPLTIDQVRELLNKNK